MAGDRVAIAERCAIQYSEESPRALSARCGINQKAVAKRRKRTSVADLASGPKDAKSTVMTLNEEAIIVALRRHTLSPLDDCLSAMPHLSRTSLHRCLQRHDISCLPEVEGEKPPRKNFKSYPLSYFYVDMLRFRRSRASCISSLQSTAPSKFAFVGL